jgi:hypothetical protein
VYGAIPPIALGHIAAVALLSLGLYKLWHHRHPRYGGMAVRFLDLAVWSFLMASAHGAGLMVLPFALDVSTPVAAAPMDHSAHGLLASRGTIAPGILAVAAHVLSYFAVLSIVAWVVYRKVGLAILRTAWFDMDRIWAAALLITGASILLFAPARAGCPAAWELAAVVAASCSGCLRRVQRHVKRAVLPVHEHQRRAIAGGLQCLAQLRCTRHR